MKMKKILSLVLTLVMAVQVCLVFADKQYTFADVTEENYPWAVNEIEEMASSRYILGYAEDHTFRPANDVSMLHSMIFGARAAGYMFAENAKVVEMAQKQYADVLAPYSFDYKKEASFLMLKGVLTQADLDDYFAEENQNKPMPRYKIAEIFTKVCNTGELPEAHLTYADAAEIPAGYEPYVQFVTDNGIMTGVGQNNFSALSTVTRAQMAVMLYRVIKLLELKVVTGTMQTLVPDSGRVFILTEAGTERITLPENTPIYAEDKKVELSALYTGYLGSVTFHGDKAVRMDAELPPVAELAEGTIAQISNNTMKLTTDTGAKTYELKSDCSVTIDEKPATVADLSVGDKATIVVAEGGLVIDIIAKAGDHRIKGVISSIVLDGANVVVSITDKATDETTAFTVDNSSKVKITRNTKTADVSDLMTGDQVDVLVRQNELYSIEATSKITDVTGKIVEIVMSETPSITVTLAGGEKATYPIFYTTAYSINGQESEIYDLRLGMMITLTLDSATVTKAEVRGSQSSLPGSTTTVTGTIAEVNTSYAVLTVNVVDAATGIASLQQIFVKNATLIDGSSGNSIKLSKVEKGATVTAIGSMSSGIFIAKTVMVVY